MQSVIPQIAPIIRDILMGKGKKSIITHQEG